MKEEGSRKEKSQRDCVPFLLLCKSAPSREEKEKEKRPTALGRSSQRLLPGFTQLATLGCLVEKVPGRARQAKRLARPVGRRTAGARRADPAAGLGCKGSDCAVLAAILLARCCLHRPASPGRARRAGNCALATVLSTWARRRTGSLPLHFVVVSGFAVEAVWTPLCALELARRALCTRRRRIRSESLTEFACCAL